MYNLDWRAFISAKGAEILSLPKLQQRCRGAVLREKAAWSGPTSGSHPRNVGYGGGEIYKAAPKSSEHIGGASGTACPAMKYCRTDLCGAVRLGYLASACAGGEIASTLGRARALAIESSLFGVGDGDIGNSIAVSIVAMLRLASRCCARCRRKYLPSAPSSDSGKHCILPAGGLPMRTRLTCFHPPCGSIA